MSQRCKQCGYADDNAHATVEDLTHWNDPSKLAPVAAWMYIKVPFGARGVCEEGKSFTCLKETVVIAFRTRHLSEREGLMEYKTLSGDTLLGKFYWTHA